MTGEDRSAAEACDETKQVPAQDRVQCGESFVKKEIRWIGGKCPCDSQPLLFATAQLAWVSVGITTGQIDLLEKRADIDLRTTSQLQLFGGVAMGEEAQILGNEADGAPQSVDVFLADIAAVAFDGAAFNFRQTVHRSE